MCLTMMGQFFKYFRANTIGQITLKSLCSWSNRVKRNKSVFPMGSTLKQGSERAEGPFLSCRCKGSPWVSAVTCTQHSHSWGQHQPSPGYPPTSREKQCKRGERNVLPSAESCFSSLEFLSRVREVIGTF